MESQKGEAKRRSKAKGHACKLVPTVEACSASNSLPAELARTHVSEEQRQPIRWCKCVCARHWRRALACHRVDGGRFAHTASAADHQSRVAPDDAASAACERLRE